MKKIIRLTEGDLHRIVKESVRKVLKEESILQQQLADDAASGKLDRDMMNVRRSKALGSKRADYQGNDLTYDSMKMQFESAIDKMESVGKPISWWEVAQEIGLKLDTLNGEDLELLKDVYDDVMYERSQI